MQNEQSNDSAKDQESSGVNLDSPEVRRALAQRIKEDLDIHVQTTQAKNFRWHLGASKIGDECHRALWYHFRWVQASKPSGRMMRLFDRGNLEEERNAKWLRGMGFTVLTHDESITKADGSHPQFRIKNKAKGHFGGSLDGIVMFPPSYNIHGYFLLEDKTSGTGAKFNSLGKEGMFKAKPEHYIQNSIYGKDYGLPYCIYICTNKNDDDMYIEVVKLDFKLAEEMEKKAETIVSSQYPPAKISETANFPKCKNLCEFKDVCHYSKPADKNCRSCFNCHAHDNGEFFCSKWNDVIPREAIPDACDAWQSITLVAKESPVTIVKNKPKSDDSMFKIDSNIALPQ